MAQPIYFVQDVASVGRQQAAELGLGGVLPQLSARQTARGPSGGGGCLASFTADRLAFDQSAQTWRKLPGGKVWFGWWNDAPPGPEDLQRAEQLPGHQVKLRDGREWLVPLARAWSDSGYSPKIPAALDFDESGQLCRGAVEPRYRDLEEAAKQFAEFFFEGGSTTYEALIGWACAALSVNYRLGRHEALALGLFDDQFIAAQDVLRAVIDWPGFQAITGKKSEGPQSDEQPTSPGVAA